MTKIEKGKLFSFFLQAIPLFAFLITTAPAATLKFGDDAPPFTLKDLSGMEIALKDFVGPERNSPGNGVILVFFATWCPSCKKELPLIDELAGEFGKKGITIILAGYQQEREELEMFLARIGVKNLIALVDRSGRVGKRYNLRVLPTIYAVTAEGTIKDLLIGESRDVQHELRKIADRLMGK